MPGVTVRLALGVHVPVMRAATELEKLTLRSMMSPVLSSARLIQPPSYRYQTLARSPKTPSMIGAPWAMPNSPLGCPFCVYETSLRT